MSATIHNRMTKKFVRLSTQDSILNARKKLANRPGAVAAILNDKGQPATVVIAEDIKNLNASDEQPLADFLSQLPIGLVIQGNMTMADFVDPERNLIDHGERGAMILDKKDQLIGILTKEAIDRYLDEEALMGPARGGSLPSTRLRGSLATTFLIKYCKVCKCSYKLSYYNWRNPPMCESTKPPPHPI